MLSGLCFRDESQHLVVCGSAFGVITNSWGSTGIQCPEARAVLTTVLLSSLCAPKATPWSERQRQGETERERARASPGVIPPGPRFQGSLPPLGRKTSGKSAFSIPAHGPAEHPTPPPGTGTQDRVRFPASPRTQSPRTARPPLPRTRRVARERAPKHTGARVRCPCRDSEGGRTLAESRADASGARPDPGRPTAGPAQPTPSPRPRRRLERISGSWAAARAAGGPSDARRRGGEDRRGGAGTEIEAPIGLQGAPPRSASHAVRSYSGRGPGPAEPSCSPFFHSVKLRARLRGSLDT